MPQLFTLDKCFQKIHPEKTFLLISKLLSDIQHSVRLHSVIIMTPDCLFSPLYRRVFSVLIMTSLCFVSIPVFMFVFDPYLCFMLSHSVSFCFDLFSPCVLFPVLFCSFCSFCFLSSSPVFVLFPTLVILCTSPHVFHLCSIAPAFPVYKSLCFVHVGSSSFMPRHSCL